MGKEGGRGFACAYTLHWHLLFPRNWDVLAQLKLIPANDEVNNVRSSQPSKIIGLVVLFDIRTSWRLEVVFNMNVIHC